MKNKNTKDVSSQLDSYNLINTITIYIWCYITLSLDCPKTES